MIGNNFINSVLMLMALYSLQKPRLSDDSIGRDFRSPPSYEDFTGHNLRPSPQAFSQASPSILLKCTKRFNLLLSIAAQRHLHVKSDVELFLKIAHSMFLSL